MNVVGLSPCSQHRPVEADYYFLDTLMSSLHSCHWDWCRFTTVLHDDLVQHVIKEHVDMAQPVRREDISLLRQVEEGSLESLEYPGQLLLIMLFKLG